MILSVLLILCSCLLLGSCQKGGDSGKDASRVDEPIATAELYHDIGAPYVSHIEPTDTDTVTMRLRLLRGNAAEVILRYTCDLDKPAADCRWTNVSMQYERADVNGYYDYYIGEIPPQKSAYRYHFIVKNNVESIILKRTVGLRASKTEEVEGLDKHEHGLPSAYADFVAAPLAAEMLDPEGIPAEPAGVPVVDTSAPALRQSSEKDEKLSKVVILTKQSKFEDLKQSLSAIGVTGITVTQVLGCGVQKGAGEYYRGVKVDMDLLPKVKVEVVVSKVPVAEVVAAARSALYTGHIGDGKIFVYDVEDVVRVRTGETGYDALQDENG